MRAAFKEWAIVVDALRTGRQIIILRKGGISEGRGGFKVDHTAFWLFPTLFHQQRESVIPEAQIRYDQISRSFPPPETLRIDTFAQVVGIHEIRSLDQANVLRGQHIWRDEVIQDKLAWGRNRTLHALALRVFRIPKPIELPMNAAWGGCKSWIELPAGLSDAGAEPALDAEEFGRKLREFHHQLEASPIAP
jgi:hypothetical protein